MGVDRVFFFKQKTAYEMRISDWSSDVCSSDLPRPTVLVCGGCGENHPHPTLPLKGRASRGGLRATGPESAEAIGECLDRLAGAGDGGVEELQVAARVRDHVREHRGAGQAAGALRGSWPRAPAAAAGAAGEEALERGRHLLDRKSTR